LLKGLEVERVGRTYVLNLSFTAATPELAARVSQGYGNAYLNDQLQSKYEATRRASVWLENRIAELKQQSYEADLKVQQFRSDNNLISASGQLVSEQQLSEINSQLITAQAATAEAKARLDQIEGLIKSGRTDAVVNQSLTSTTINTLRERYLDTSRLRTEIEGKLGPNHIQVVRLAAQMTELERMIFDELRRIADSDKSDYNVALSRQKSLEDSLAKTLGVNATANTTQVRLRELERESATFKLLYDSFLQRYQETIQQQSFPISNARIITRATLPTAPSFPRKPTVLGLFLFLGIMASAGVAVLREYRDRFFRTGDQVRSVAKVEFLGFAPMISADRSKGGVASAASDPGEKLWHPNSMSVHVRAHPLSLFAETLRNVKVAADMALPKETGKVIGVVSCLPGEGKTTIAANLGVLLTMQGARVTLVDGDLRNPDLTRTLATTPPVGLIEVLVDPLQAKVPVLRDGSGRLSVVPTVVNGRVSHTSELLASPRMARLLSNLTAQCDYTIVDLPPIGPVVDAKAFAHRVDAFVFVVEWGKTSRQLLRSVMRNNPAFYEKCLGVILNKSDESRMKLYETSGSADYYASRYKGYHKD
jgi:succinoglycan biosynthesis transport protein ExoP